MDSDRGQEEQTRHEERKAQQAAEGTGTSSSAEFINVNRQLTLPRPFLYRARPIVLSLPADLNP